MSRINTTKPLKIRSVNEIFDFSTIPDEEKMGYLASLIYALTIFTSDGLTHKSPLEELPEGQIPTAPKLSIYHPASEGGIDSNVPYINNLLQSKSIGNPEAINSGFDSLAIEGKERLRQIISNNKFIAKFIRKAVPEWSKLSQELRDLFEKVPLIEEVPVTEEAAHGVGGSAGAASVSSEDAYQTRKDRVKIMLGAAGDRDDSSRRAGYDYRGSVSAEIDKARAGILGGPAGSPQVTGGGGVGVASQATGGIKGGIK